MLVNFSNIGWFGNTSAVDQHLQSAGMRALELERPMVCATKHRATVIIDHRGAVTHALERFSRGVLRGEVHGRGLGCRATLGITPLPGGLRAGGCGRCGCLPARWRLAAGQITPPHAGSGLMQVTLCTGSPNPAMRVYTRRPAHFGYYARNAGAAD